jgi:hypothetical protein
MKKISLKDVKNGLKRDEMRTIQGGRMTYDGCWLMCRASGGFNCSHEGTSGWLCQVG